MRCGVPRARVVVDALPERSSAGAGRATAPARDREFTQVQRPSAVRNMGKGGWKEKQ